MNKINNIENEENKNASELAESRFDEDWYNDLINEIKEKKAEQKESDKKRADKITENLFKKEKMPINDFIESEKQKGNDGDTNIIINLIKAWYKENEIMNSSLRGWWEKIKKEIINSVLRPHIFRFDNEQEIDEKFFSIIEEYVVKWTEINHILNNMPLKRAITMEDIKYWEKKIHEHSQGAFFKVDLSGHIIPDFDWSNSREVFNYLKFDDKTFSKTSKEHLPEWFDPKTVFENWKTIGLWIDDVHKIWYTWKWVNVAICDWQLKPHDDIKTETYTVEKNANNVQEYFHASAVSSILAWKQTGVAPDTNLYFFAEWQNNMEKSGGQDLVLSLNKILEINKSLADSKKIRVVSISGPLYWEWVEKIVKKLEDSWVWVLDSDEFWKDFWYLEKKDPMWDPNDFNNYQHRLWKHKQLLRKSDALFVNSGDRTLADPKSPTAYRHDSWASASWAIPVVAWYYALACQADPTMTPRKFKKLARESAHEIDSTIRSEKNGEVKRSKETRKIKVIDIKALIQKIEEEKNK